MDRERNFGLDMVRAVAAALVLAVHFFMNIGYFNVPFSGAAMAAGAVARMALMPCVPLFLMLTGYLCIHREWSGRYYRGLMPILLTYLLAAAVCLIFRMGSQGEQYSPITVVLMVLDFDAAPYGWYVEMYIGLFLLSPFLNAAWSALSDRTRLALVITLVALTSLPAVTNAAGQILPDWWLNLYPLTYYFAGAWLREHPLKWNGGWLLAGWMVPAIVAGVGQYFAQDLLMPGTTFRVGEINYWASLFTLIETVCLFSLLSRVKGERCPRVMSWCVTHAARLSLSLYLVSYITDQLIYPILNGAVPTVAERLPFLPVMVLVSLILSGIMAQLIQWAVDGLMKLLSARKVHA